ncbi:cyclic pyranopterin monophosphate synthase [bacterium BMS3Abin05]|nr:cyclic pyranopterin monophosphate synthase [bacterium BMS3Abin05]GBE26894.1 cyclic pyranopterin monophosphate synthase [bacterium BMS3Bbin03]HDL78731.1 radical SAM protein [Bacteroidota bacterium]HDZ10672.1 radical SAM protein [Bacteroidota bacterium]
MILNNLKNFTNVFKNRPILCNYYVTYRCNARCVFCDFWQREDYKHSQDAGLKEVIRNLQDLRRMGVIFVDFTGGEPLLNKDLPQMLKEAKRLGFITSVTTNTILYPGRAQQLKGLVDILHFSLDSLNPKRLNTLRGVPVFERLMESIDLALSLGEKPDLLFTVTAQNAKEMPQLVTFAQKRKLLLVTNPVFSYFGNTGISESALKYIEIFQNASYVYVNRAYHHFIRSGGNQRGNPRCRGVSSTVVISPQNELLLPCFHHRSQTIPIGTSLPEALNSKQRREALKNQGRYSFCQNCTINCYFDPSFLYKRDPYFYLSVWPKLKYEFEKTFQRTIRTE